MTLQELVNETLVEKNRRFRQAKCPHEEIHSSTVAGPTGTFTNSFCLDCGKSRHRAAPAVVFAGRKESPMSETPHQSLLAPAANKFHVGNGDDGKHYWLSPPTLLASVANEFGPFFDPCPFPLPEGFDGLTCEWGKVNYVNPPFGSIVHQGKKKGPTAWVRKAIEEWQKGKTVVLVYPVDKWLLMLVKAIFGEHGDIRNLGDVKWLATEDGSQGKGTGRHIAQFILRGSAVPRPDGDRP